MKNAGLRATGRSAGEGGAKNPRREQEKCLFLIFGEHERRRGSLGPHAAHSEKPDQGASRSRSHGRAEQELGPMPRPGDATRDHCITRSRMAHITLIKQLSCAGRHHHLQSRTRDGPPSYLRRVSSNMNAHRIAKRFAQRVGTAFAGRSCSYQGKTYAKYVGTRRKLVKDANRKPSTSIFQSSPVRAAACTKLTACPICGNDSSW